MLRRAAGLKAFYLNLRIKNKMFVLITFVMLTVSAISLTVQQYAFNVYDRELYRQSANALHVSSYGIENELKKLERLSFRAATDAEIQSYLAAMRDHAAEYNRFVIGEQIRTRLLELGGFDKYVLSLQIYDRNGAEYAVGNKLPRLSEARTAKMIRAAREKQGGIRWIFPDEDDDALVAAREIRSIPHLELAHIGTVAIRIDVNRLFADFAGEPGNREAQFLMMEGDRLVYPRETPYDFSGFFGGTKGGQGYRIVTAEEERLFVTYLPSSYTNWVYLIAIPYGDIFQAIVTVKNTVLLLFALLFVIVIAAAVRFARGITRPIESLNAKMKRVMLGNFNLEDGDESVRFPMDEAGQLHRNFRIMIGRINELITENYKKQLTIKDSEFRALQAQINPHFLYNTLETINWSAKMNGQRQISHMVESLGYLLRSSISVKEPLIPLGQELEIVKHYITIQRIRFEERLDFAMDVPQELYGAEVPKFSLQPLVENAINYGLERMVEPCRIRIAAAVRDGCLKITVEDNGPGMDAAVLRKLDAGELKARGSGIGLRNIQERIKLLFGEAYGIGIESVPGAGTKVTVTLPAGMGERDVQRAVGG